jgi:hypothetical protein
MADIVNGRYNFKADPNYDPAKNEPDWDNCHHKPEYENHPLILLVNTYIELLTAKIMKIKALIEKYPKRKQLLKSMKKACDLLDWYMCFYDDYWNGVDLDDVPEKVEAVLKSELDQIQICDLRKV